MSDCCSSNQKSQSGNTYHRCPGNGIEYPTISSYTVMHQVHNPWQYDLNGNFFYFCNDPNCEIVYFTDQNVTINKAGLRSQIGAKETSVKRTLCYCFGITEEQLLKDTSLKNFVITATKEKKCACEIRNPSGRCCLRDFPKNK